MLQIDATGPPIGWDLDDSWAVSEYQLAKGDKILLYTDGLIEVKNSEGAYCHEDIFSEVDSSFTVEEMLLKVFSAAESFCNGAFTDDLTILAISIDEDPQAVGAAG